MSIWKLCHPATFIITALSLGIAPSSDAAQRYKWWQSDRVKTDLQLSAVQVEELEMVFQDMRSALTDLLHALRIEEKRLTEAMHEAEDEEWEITLLIDRVESARSALSKTRLLMLYRMHLILDSNQVDKLHERYERLNNRRGSSRRNRR